MSGETSATYNVSGTIIFREEVTPERAEELLRALGSLGLDLHLQASGDQPPITSLDTRSEAPRDYFANITDMVNFAQRSGVAPTVGAKVWHAIGRLYTSNSALAADSSGHRQIQGRMGEAYITGVSLSSLRNLVALADSVAPPHIRSKDIRRMHLEQALGGRLGPKSVEFVRRFVADAEANTNTSFDRQP